MDLDPGPKRPVGKIRIQKDPRAGSGSEMTLQIGSGSEINSFGSATLVSTPQSSELPLVMQELQLLLKPISDNISEVQAFRERSRRSEMFNHLSAISESISALGTR